MKRDMELIRSLILSLETAESGTDSSDINIAGYDEKSIAYHMTLLTEGGFIRTSQMRAGVIFNAMTWSGHDFADACRDEGVWKKSISAVKDKAASASFDVLLSVLKSTLTTLIVGS